MKVYIAGAGKLATELLHGLDLPAPLQVQPWLAGTAAAEQAIVVHAGSGRQLDEIIDFCGRTGSVLIELSTGSKVEALHLTFPVVLCPNTNLLMLKFMSLLDRAGGLFKGYDIHLTESHQASKTSVPGTAVAIADSLGLPATQIESVRDPAEQLSLGIPADDLHRHAFHRIRINDSVCSVTLETRVLGDAPYAAGVSAIVAAAHQKPLAARTYPIQEFVDKGWV